MTLFSYTQSAEPIRADLIEGHRRAWEHLARPGAWWTGTERVAIAAAVRSAPDCALCSKRLGALSPYGVEGKHDHAGNLPEAAVDAGHRITTDPARLKQEWLEELVAAGLTVEQYVELVGVLTTVLSIDEFHRAMGFALEPLPDPIPGKPSNRRPSGAALEGAWVPMVKPARLDSEDRDLYGAKQTGNVIRALSLVPEEVRNLRQLGGAQYLSEDKMMEFGRGRSLDRRQIELIAARVSALNECFY